MTDQLMIDFNIVTAVGTVGSMKHCWSRWSCFSGRNS